MWAGPGTIICGYPQIMDDAVDNQPQLHGNGSLLITVLTWFKLSGR